MVRKIISECSGAVSISPFDILRVSALRAENRGLFPRLLKWTRRSLVERTAAHFLFEGLHALLSRLYSQTTVANSAV